MKPSKTPKAPHSASVPPEEREGSLFSEDSERAFFAPPSEPFKFLFDPVALFELQMETLCLFGDLQCRTLDALSSLAGMQQAFISNTANAAAGLMYLRPSSKSK